MSEPGRQPLRRPMRSGKMSGAGRLFALLSIPVVLTLAACHEHSYGPDGKYVSGASVPLKPTKASMAKTSRPKSKKSVTAKTTPAARRVVVTAAKKSPPATASVENVKVAAAVTEASVGAADAAPTELTEGARIEATRIEAWSAAVAKDLAQGCKAGDPADAAALQACRQLVFASPKLRKAVAPVALWGRQHPGDRQAIGDSGLTELSPDVLFGLYLPLFMFDGSSRVSQNDTDKLYRVELGAAFRSRLAAGDFPEPLWHDGEQWKALQRTTAVVLWLSPEPLGLKAVEWLADDAATAAAQPVAPPRSFDGKWMWTDDSGALQPKIAQFAGLLQPENPFLEKLSASYHQLAQSLDDGKCSSCHVPSNPNSMKRLVLLQTPVHAAGEVQRLIKSVDSGSMPVDPQSGAAIALDADVKSRLLATAREFEALVDKAKAWERKRAQESAAASP